MNDKDLAEIKAFFERIAEIIKSFFSMFSGLFGGGKEEDPSDANSAA